eukprot:IDg18458t1
MATDSVPDCTGEVGGSQHSSDK